MTSPSLILPAMTEDSTLHVPINSLRCSNSPMARNRTINGYLASRQFTTWPCRIGDEVALTPKSYSVLDRRYIGFSQTKSPSSTSPFCLSVFPSCSFFSLPLPLRPTPHLFPIVGKLSDPAIPLGARSADAHVYDSHRQMNTGS